MTQCDRVIDYINKFGSITSRDAVIDLGIMELPARICDLQRKGYTFKKRSESSKNRFGEKVHYIRYSLDK